MGAFKRGLEDLSVALGFDGVVAGEVLAVAKAEQLTGDGEMVTAEQTAAAVAECLAREAGSYRTGRAALRACGPGTVAILMGAEYLVVRGRTADRLAELGLPFAYLGEMRNEDGRDVVVTVPVN